MPEQKTSRYQAIVWRESVLIPIINDPRVLKDGWPFDPRMKPNLEQLCRYYPDFAKAIEAFEAGGAEANKAYEEGDREGAAHAVIEQARTILHQLPTETSTFELASGLDKMEEQVVALETAFLREKERATNGWRFLIEAREALRVAAMALDIAVDWDLENVQVDPPRAWNLEAHGEDVSDGWCATTELARKLRELGKES
jgi:hypothetical protein